MLICWLKILMFQLIITVSEVEKNISERVISNKPPILKVTQPEIPKLRQKKIPGSENIQKAFAFWNR